MCYKHKRINNYIPNGMESFMIEKVVKSDKTKLNILDGGVTAKDFFQFIKNNLPNYYSHISATPTTTLHVILTELHTLTKCNYPFVDDIEYIDDARSKDFLHQLMLSITAKIPAIERMYTEI